MRIDIVIYGQRGKAFHSTMYTIDYFTTVSKNQIAKTSLHFCQMAHIKIKIKPQETLRKTLDNTSL